jgi:5'-deoxynucleotidase YfbR-like HD superfamily hydrolase
VREDTKLVEEARSAAHLLNMQLDAIVGGGYTRRFHTVNTIQNNSVGHHSFGVALLCFLLADGNPSKQLLMAALTHDLGEQFTGDMPAPAKRAMGIRESFGIIEEQALSTLGLSFPLDQRDTYILKLADVLDGMMFCTTELRLGNVGIRAAYNNFRGYAVSVLNSSDIDRTIFDLVVDTWESINGR